MKAYLILPWLLAAFIIGGCEKRHTEHGKSQPSPRVWLGASFIVSDKGLKIDQVMSGSTFDNHGVRTGDLLISFEGNKITSYSSLVNAVENLSSRNNVSATLMRDTFELKYTMDLGLLFFQDDDEYQSEHRNKKCDSDCNCTISANNHDCLLFYLNKGEGDNGGVKFEKNCIWVGPAPDFPEGSKKCGIGEYF